MSDKISVQMTIFGRVQGVFYRDSTRQQAEKLNLTGWVRNNDDGSVETVLSGERADVEQMITWCRKGPPAAKVSRVELMEVPFEFHRQFVILRD